MSPVPIDVIDLIIRSVDHHHHLFTLLSVSRKVFEIAARWLYRDPLRFQIDRERLSQLLRLLLSLSPADDVQTALLREAAGLPPKQAEHGLMLNYLALVRVFIWGKRVNPHELQRQLDWKLPSIVFKMVPGDFKAKHRFQSQFVNHYLTFAIVGHQLGVIQELEIEVGDIERYIALASQMSNVTRILMRSVFRRDDLFGRIEPLIFAIQKHHGKDQLRDCRMVRTPAELYPKRRGKGLEMKEALRLYSLLPGPKKPLELSGHDKDGATSVFLDRPLDPELAQMTRMLLYSDFKVWRRIQSEYPDLSRAQLLQRFRNLRELTVGITPWGEDLFHWAVHEAEQLQQWKQRAKGAMNQGIAPQSQPVPPPLVPISTLTLEHKSPEVPVTLKTIDSALRAFSESLRHLRLIISSSEFQPRPWTFQMPGIMLHLETLHLLVPWDVLVDPSIWDCVPNLQNAHILHSSSEPPVGQQAQRPAPVFPSSRIISSSIRHLQLEYQTPSLDGGYLNALPFVSRWIWQLPNLKELFLKADLDKLGFSFSMLKHCPVLQTLQLVAVGPFFLSIEEDPVEIGSTTPVLNRHVQDLMLKGRWASNRSNMWRLFKGLPGLVSFTYTPVVTFRSLPVGRERLPCHDIVELTRDCDHPSLRTVALLCTVDPPAKLGLVGAQDISQWEFESMGVRYDLGYLSYFYPKQ